MPLYRTAVRHTGQEKGASPLFRGMPHARGQCLLAPHGGDAFEDDAAHERDAHTKAGEGERGVRAHLDATSIESHGENGEDRADCEASDAGTVKSGLGVGVGVHCRNPFLLVALLSTTKILEDARRFVYMNCHQHKPNTIVLKI